MPYERIQLQLNLSRPEDAEIVRAMDEFGAARSEILYAALRVFLLEDNGAARVIQPRPKTRAPIKQQGQKMGKQTSQEGKSEQDAPRRVREVKPVPPAASPPGPIQASTISANRIADDLAPGGDDLMKLVY